LKIDKTPPLPRVSVPESPRGTPRSPEPPSRADEAGSNPTVTTHLDKALTDTSQDINAARVDSIKEAIREGRLEVQAEKIADKLIASAQDLLKSDAS